MSKNIKILLLGIIVLGTIFITFSLFNSSPEAALTKEEAKKIVQNRYSGNVNSIKKVQLNGEDVYHMRLETDKGIYNVTVNSHTKEIENMKLLEKHLAKSEQTIEEAKIAIEKHTNGKVTDIKESDQNGQSVAISKVKVGSEEKEVTYSLKDKKVLTINSAETNAHTTKPKQPEQKKTLIPQNRAINIAKKQVNGKVEKAELINTKQGQQYKITILTTKEIVNVYVQANSGKVGPISRKPKQQRPANKPKIPNNNNNNSNINNNNNSNDDDDSDDGNEIDDDRDDQDDD
ncbi:PepSY domain-containing protein [Bacillus sp. JJ722]|uniref:PepSY domain-containing protein n=1 Tax=Bacillus sp. JJ722 TaxID=3122973 RepID=UPI002FFF7D64